MKKPDNELKMTVEARSINEGFSRAAVGAFVSQLDPTVEELSDIKTSVSEAVTNCIVHAYKEKKGLIYITVRLYDGDRAVIKIRDSGVGIADIKKAREPLYSSLGGERSGLGFTVMESFSDKLRVTSSPGRGTVVTIEKSIGGKK